MGDLTIFIFFLLLGYRVDSHTHVTYYYAPFHYPSSHLSDGRYGYGIIYDKFSNMYLVWFVRVFISRKCGTDRHFEET